MRSTDAVGGRRPAPRGAGHGWRATFASAYDPRRNNFDFIRFALATLVIWSHSFPLSGRTTDWLYAASGQIDGGSLAVDGFFVLSGFLVMQSWLAQPDVTAFATKRGLRIGPALVVALAFGALVIGPLVADEGAWAYLRSPAPWEHFLGVALHRFLRCAGTFSRNPIPGLVNSSLWSLRYELLCYAMVAALGRAAGRHVGAVTAAVFALAWLACLVVPATPLRLLACFSAGQVFYVARGRVPYATAVAVAAVLVLAATCLLGGFRSAFPIAGGYLVFWSAFNPRLALSRFGRYGDFSYGLYVFAYPIQQTLVHVFANRLSLGGLFAAAFAATLVLAVLSWHLIEAPALALRRRIGAARPAAGTAPGRPALVADGG